MPDKPTFEELKRRIEGYNQEHSDARFSHSICRECAERYSPGLKIYDD